MYKDIASWTYHHHRICNVCLPYSTIIHMSLKQYFSHTEIMANPTHRPVEEFREKEYPQLKGKPGSLPSFPELYANFDLDRQNILGPRWKPTSFHLSH
jgi:hypothetical protein